MPCPSLETLWGPGSEGAALAVAVQRVPGWDAKKNSKYCTVGVPAITPCPRAISSWPGKDNATHALCTNTHTHACTHTHALRHTQSRLTRTATSRPTQAHPHTRLDTQVHTHTHTHTHTHIHTVGRGVRESEQQLRAQAVPLGGGGCTQVAEFLRALVPHGCNTKDHKTPLCPDEDPGRRQQTGTFYESQTLAHSSAQHWRRPDRQTETLASQTWRGAWRNPPSSTKRRRAHSLDS